MRVKKCSLNLFIAILHLLCSLVARQETHVELDPRHRMGPHRIRPQGIQIQHDCSHIVFEDLTYIRVNIPKATWQHVWAFRRLYEYVEYKAEEYGVEVLQVDPRNTSKRCSTCGFTHSDNRSSEAFYWQKCEFENHADNNASKNIGLQYLRRRQNANDGDAPVDVRLNRGTLNVNGEYSPTALSG